MELARAESQRRSDTAAGHGPDGTAGSIPLPDLERVIDEAAHALGGLQRDDGHWVFELEADATIPAEYVLLNHFLDERDPETEARLGVYIRARQADHDGWPLFHGGAFDLSCTVKAYYALKLIGDDSQAPHMVRAREAVLAAGGAAQCNVFSRITLALFGQVPWRAVPAMPVEMVHLPRWFPFHLTKVSYWSRTTIVPLSILLALKPRARNPRGFGIAELFTTPPAQELYNFPKRTGTERLFLGLDRALAFGEQAIPHALRRRAVNRALDWCLTRLNGDDGLGAIFPPMANVLMAFDTLGYGRDHPARRTARRAIDLLLTEPVDGSQYVQPCVSPVWDTGLAALSLMECGGEDELSGGAGLPPLARRPPDPRCRRRLGGDEAPCAARRVGLSVPQRLLPRRGRYGGRGHGAPPRRSRDAPRGDRTGGRVDRRHAERERRLGRLRRR